MLNESREAVIKLFNDYSSIASETRKQFIEKEFYVCQHLQLAIRSLTI